MVPFTSAVSSLRFQRRTGIRYSEG